MSREGGSGAEGIECGPGVAIMIVSSIEASEGTGLGVAEMLRSPESDSEAAVKQIDE